MNNWTSYLNAIETLRSSSQDFISVTLAKSDGSTPQDVGAKAIISTRGLEYGTIGGGKIENHVIAFAQLMLRDELPFSFCEWNLQKDIGMTCGGVVSFFFELHKHQSTFRIAIFGAGHIAQQLVRLLLNLDCHLICIDSRQEWLNKLPNSKSLQIICTPNPRDEVKNLPENTYVSIMTMGHATDLPILSEALKQRHRFRYIGNIGSQTKRLRLESDLLKNGLTKEDLNSFFCPMGEEFGNNSPIEISFSIVAQILKKRDQIINSK